MVSIKNTFKDHYQLSGVKKVELIPTPKAPSLTSAKAPEIPKQELNGLAPPIRTEVLGEGPRAPTKGTLA